MDFDSFEMEKIELITSGLWKTKFVELHKTIEENFWRSWLISQIHQLLDAIA